MIFSQIVDRNMTCGSNNFTEIPGWLGGTVVSGWLGLGTDLWSVPFWLKPTPIQLPRPRHPAESVNTYSRMGRCRRVVPSGVKPLSRPTTIASC